jgi:nitrate/TMAO reductase-like tetraheme cytochrome c subunit
MDSDRAGTSAPDNASPTRPAIAVFTSHWLAMTGLGLVLTAIVLWSCLVPVTLRGGQDNPYIGVATTLVGGVLVVGVVLTPLGLYLGRRRLADRLANALLDRKAAWRRFLVFLLVVSAVNLVIASQATARVVHHMETKQFCGSCHVMTPETRAFDQGPHAGLACVDCHVGDGAKGFVASKLQGARQLLSVLTDHVEVPIAGAIASGRMVPSEETCEQCHWKGQSANATLKMIRRYAEDEANTPQTTLLTMNVGGTRMGGIHGAHHGEGISVRFVATDPGRQDIPLVEYENAATGERRTYVRAGATAASYADAPRITMQCFDCHNRAAHAFQMPGPAVDQALTLGRIPADLPFVKKAAMELLEAEYPSSAAAAEAIPAGLVAFYERSHPEVLRARADDVREAGAVLADVYSRNVFPELDVTWGTYPDNRGHETSPGCFRCHQGEHVTESGEEITKNCFRCHHPAAVSEADPKVLELLGVDKLLRQLQK